MKKVLITGMSGLIGTALRGRLEGRCELTALNRSAVAGVRCVQADIADFAAMRPAFDKQDTVVHLAAIASNEAPWEDVLNHNMIGTYNVYEAARQAGVNRVIFASSGATISNWEREEPFKHLVSGDYEEVLDGWPMIDHNSPTRPTGLYGCSKIWGESLGRHFSDTAGISVINVRIGRVHASDEPMATRDYSVWCSQRDVATLLEACVDAPSALRYETVFAVSNNAWAYRDMDHARRVLGFVPRDGAESHRKENKGK